MMMTIIRILNFTVSAEKVIMMMTITVVLLVPSWALFLPSASVFARRWANQVSSFLVGHKTNFGGRQSVGG